ncbi:MAG: MT-A70 family methyltransferase [Thermoguttaceae bacterium]|nr:MT-A70 family methyltransferase [Thermoguttaceae bacterium]
MNNNVTCPITEITMTSDRRKIDRNKVGELAQSIRNVGLINPITITADRQLVAGAHRLEACKSLGMSDISCIIFDGSDLQKELAEIDENLVRLELDPISIGELAIRRDEILDALGQRAKSGTNVKNSRTGTPGGPVPKTTEDVANEIGISKSTLKENKQLARDLTPKAKDVVRQSDVSKKDALKLARMKPEEQNKLAEKLSNGEAKSLVDAKRLVVKETMEEPESLSADIKYRVIYADPPWSYGNKLVDGYGAAENHYPTMSLEELCNLPVIDMTEENAVLFLWTTSPLLEECFQVIRSWGFKYKTSFVWDKVKHNMGHYNSVRHELLLVCTKGSCTPDVQKLFDSVVVQERSDRHSEKPEVFREIIDTLYTHGKKLELFARKTVPGWDVWGNQT